MTGAAGAELCSSSCCASKHLSFPVVGLVTISPAGPDSAAPACFSSRPVIEARYLCCVKENVLPSTSSTSTGSPRLLLTLALLQGWWFCLDDHVLNSFPHYIRHKQAFLCSQSVNLPVLPALPFTQHASCPLEGAAWLSRLSGLQVKEVSSFTESKGLLEKTLVLVLSCPLSQL